HTATAALLVADVWLGLSDVDRADRDRHVHPRTGLDLVLAWTNVGPQRRRVRQERRSPRHDRDQQDWEVAASGFSGNEPVEIYLRPDCSQRLLHRGRALLPLADDGRLQEDSLAALP